MNQKIAMISLGCDKNRVDSENILYSLTKAGCSVVQNAEEADVIIINTCAFIEAAKKESIDTILEYSGLKKNGVKKLVVTGCLAERYGKDLVEALPEVDVFVGINSYHDIAAIVESDKKLIQDGVFTPYDKGRVLTTPAHYAYLKIAEGCDNFCTYCAIPFIRGRYRSEPMETLVAEAERLSMSGVKELILVAQDITRYGKDLYGKYCLIDLLKKLCALPFVKIRLMYAYPELITDELILYISGEEKIAKYLDIPMQHADNNVLRRMNRRENTGELRRLTDKIRASGADIAVRSSFIVGFPGETDEEFENLKSFIAEGRIDYAGFFTYSKEEGTAAAKMKNQVPAHIKKARAKELTAIQSAVIVKKHEEYLGKTVRVLYEGIDYKRKMFFGRTERNAPDIDTKVYFTADMPLDIGEYYDVKITATGFHLTGEAL